MQFFLAIHIRFGTRNAKNMPCDGMESNKKRARLELRE